jgi:hypothetical protein
LSDKGSSESHTTRGLPILVARLTSREHKEFFNFALFAGRNPA